MKCCKCEVEFLVRKEVAAKRFEKGITLESYVCRTCRPKSPKKVYVKKKKLPKRDAFGRFVKKNSNRDPIAIHEATQPLAAWA
jgi:hypothetical protein